MPTEYLSINLGSEEGENRNKINKQMPCLFGGQMERKTSGLRDYFIARVYSAVELSRDSGV